MVSATAKKIKPPSNEPGHILSPAGFDDAVALIGAAKVLNA